MIRILAPGDEAAIEAFLQPRVETSMFLLGNMRTAGLADTGQAYTGTYAAVLEEDRIAGIVAHYWNRNIVVQAPGDPGALCRAAAAASRRPIGGLIGPNDQVEAAKEDLAIDASRIQLDETEKLYSLQLHDLLVPEGLRSGRLSARRIEPRDVELIARWQVGYAIEALGEEDSPQLREKNRVSTERLLGKEHTWVLLDEGEPVACSSFNAAIREAVQVGGVWTPPELRRRGYARAVVAASLLDARREGVEKAILFTGESNIAAQKAYVALGFQHIGDYRLLFLRPPLEVCK